MNPESSLIRDKAYGQDAPLSPVDRFGVWLSAQRIHKHVPSFRQLRIADFGCGFDANFARTVLDDVDSATLVDVDLSPAVAAHPRVRAIRGDVAAVLPTLPANSFDLVLCISVLEHLREPIEALADFRRLLVPGGTCLINVPSWRGKWFLEFSAFSLGLSPAAEMDDHKMYYDPRDLWPLLVRAGFRPREIRCFKHKLGLNTFAACRVLSS